MKKNFVIKTLGCKTNQIESAIIEEKLTLAGFNCVSKIEDAQYFILNSCSVTSHADNKALSTLKTIKKQNPNIITVLTGCFAQLEHKNLKNNPNIDILVGNQEKTDIVEIIQDNQTEVMSDIFSHTEFRYERLNTLKKTRATIKIQDGCNNRCTYCTIPFARGQNRSNSVNNIVEQINLLKEHGFEEVVLTGIHIGQWGDDFSPKMSLINLLQEIEKTDITRYRLGSLNPLELTDELIDFLSKSEKFCPHFHLSLQSACDKTLLNMNRHYSFELASDIIQKINEKFIRPFIGSDVIVGFPGETDEDFEVTYSNLKEAKTSQIHVFPYSIRKNTIAASMPNQVKDSLKKERVSKLLALSNKKLDEFLQENIGHQAQVIIEPSPDKKTGLKKGMTPNYINVLIENADGFNQGEIVNVKLIELSNESRYIKGKV